jgi:AcrR family transcriptional regulator
MRKSAGSRAVAIPALGREPRGARRKRETRDKLLRSAYRHMAERGVDGVAINEITEAADVGFGSFYNHFDSKDAVYEAVFQIVFEEFGTALDRLVANVEDPAERIGICVRQTLARARKEPLWGRFLLREGYRPEALTRGLGARLLRDVQSGIAQKRFKVTDPLMAVIVAGGTVMGSVAAGLMIERGRAAAFEQLGLGTEKIPERAAAVLLQGLGLSAREAAKIAHRALPPFESPRALR